MRAVNSEIEEKERAEQAICSELLIGSRMLQLPRDQGQVHMPFHFHRTGLEGARQCFMSATDLNQGQVSVHPVRWVCLPDPGRHGPAATTSPSILPPWQQSHARNSPATKKKRE
jgi:hypothetical protein